jgi:hypothetical protein
MGREHAVRGAKPLEGSTVERDELLSVVGGHAQILATIGSALLGFLLLRLPWQRFCRDIVRPRPSAAEPTQPTRTMATKELHALRLAYKAAYTAYMNCVQALADASQRGRWPSQEVLTTEEKALAALTHARQALLDALFEHHRKK